MNIYLAAIEYNITNYLYDKPTKHIRNHLVKAESMEEAERKAREFYENKTVEYSIYYNVLDVDINETII